MGPFPKYDIELKRIREEGYKEGFKIGYKEGYKIGIEIGVRESSLKIAKRLLDTMEPEQIATLLDLTLDQVLALRENALENKAQNP